MNSPSPVSWIATIFHILHTHHQISVHIRLSPVVRHRPRRSPPLSAPRLNWFPNTVPAISCANVMLHLRHGSIYLFLNHNPRHYWPFATYFSSENVEYVMWFVSYSPLIQITVSNHRLPYRCKFVHSPQAESGSLRLMSRFRYIRLGLVISIEKLLPILCLAHKTAI